MTSVIDIKERNAAAATSVPNSMLLLLYNNITLYGNSLVSNYLALRSSSDPSFKTDLSPPPSI